MSSNVPSRVRHNVVQLLIAQFAKVVFRTLALVHDADAAAVLPYMALVALDEKATGFVSSDVG